MDHQPKEIRDRAERFQVRMLVRFERAQGFVEEYAHNLSDGGLFTGNASQFGVQVVGVLGTYVFCGVGTFVILLVVRALVGLRVHEEDEHEGLDLTQHAENAYSAQPGGALGELSAH